MLVSEMIDKVLRTTTMPDTDFIDNKREVIMDYISAVQQDWAERTGRFEKRAYTNTRVTGSEDADSRYNLIERPALGFAGLPYAYLSIRGVMWNGKPLERIQWSRYTGLKARNNGEAVFGDPTQYWESGHVLFLWPVPDSVQQLRVLYTARPKEISAETEYIAAENPNIILTGVMSKLYTLMKDTERAGFFYNEFRERCKHDAEYPTIATSDFTPYENSDSESGYVGRETGQYFT